MTDESVRPDRPKEYFDRLWRLEPSDTRDAAPPTSPEDWANAEEIIPVDPDALKALPVPPERRALKRTA